MTNPFDFPPGEIGFGRRPVPHLSPALIPMLLLILAAGLAGFFISRLIWHGTPDATPRVALPRGELGADEKSTIDIFKQTIPSVVFITTLGESYNIFTGDSREVPQGTGSGFIWDDAGDIVT